MSSPSNTHPTRVVYTTEGRGRLRTVLARAFVFLGMFGACILLLVDANYWTTTQILHSSLAFPSWIVTIIGGIMAVNAILAFWAQFRDFCYAITSGFYGLITVAYGIALFTGVNVGALVAAVPVLAWLYAESAVLNSSSYETKKFYQAQTSSPEEV